jgi:hypothetical protein
MAEVVRLNDYCLDKEVLAAALSIGSKREDGKVGWKLPYPRGFRGDRRPRLPRWEAGRHGDVRPEEPPFLPRRGGPGSPGSDANGQTFGSK